MAIAVNFFGCMLLSVRMDPALPPTRRAFVAFPNRPWAPLDSEGRVTPTQTNLLGFRSTRVDRPGKVFQQHIPRSRSHIQEPNANVAGFDVIAPRDLALDFDS